ncbi:MAG: hypothetical protein K8S25_15775 [Alphaproteobacteria bacterium]|nr:hypothetical protein [Alphaproteobacteria bacterium]
MKRHLFVASAALLSLSVANAAPPSPPSASESAAIFKAAGFKAKGGKHVRCEDDVTISYSPGAIEMEDLNADGQAEAWVKEGSLFCYGNTAEAFVLLTKDATGAWAIILDEVGIPVVLDTKHKGFRDIEVGGPGMGPFPKFRFDGKKYVSK